MIEVQADPTDTSSLSTILLDDGRLINAGDIFAKKLMHYMSTGTSNPIAPAEMFIIPCSVMPEIFGTQTGGFEAYLRSNQFLDNQHPGFELIEIERGPGMTANRHRSYMSYNVLARIAHEVTIESSAALAVFVGAVRQKINNDPTSTAAIGLKLTNSRAQTYTVQVTPAMLGGAADWGHVARGAFDTLLRNFGTSPSCPQNMLDGFAGRGRARDGTFAAFTGTPEQWSALSPWDRALNEPDTYGAHLGTGTHEVIGTTYTLDDLIFDEEVEDAKLKDLLFYRARAFEQNVVLISTTGKQSRLLVSASSIAQFLLAFRNYFRMMAGVKPDAPSSGGDLSIEEMSLYLTERLMQKKFGSVVTVGRDALGRFQAIFQARDGNTIRIDALEAEGAVTITLDPTSMTAGISVVPGLGIPIASQGRHVFTVQDHSMSNAQQWSILMNQVIEFLTDSLGANPVSSQTNPTTSFFMRHLDALVAGNTAGTGSAVDTSAQPFDRRGYNFIIVSRGLYTAATQTFDGITYQVQEVKTGNILGEYVASVNWITGQVSMTYTPTGGTPSSNIIGYDLLPNPMVRAINLQQRICAQSISSTNTQVRYVSSGITMDSQSSGQFVIKLQYLDGNDPATDPWVDMQFLDASNNLQDFEYVVTSPLTSQGMIVVESTRSSEELASTSSSSTLLDRLRLFAENLATIHESGFQIRDESDGMMNEYDLISSGIVIASITNLQVGNTYSISNLLVATGVLPGGLDKLSTINYKGMSRVISAIINTRRQFDIWASLNCHFSSMPSVTFFNNVEYLIGNIIIQSLGLAVDSRFDPITCEEFFKPSTNLIWSSAFPGGIAGLVSRYSEALTLYGSLNSGTSPTLRVERGGLGHLLTLVIPTINPSIGGSTFIGPVNFLVFLNGRDSIITTPGIYRFELGLDSLHLSNRPAGEFLDIKYETEIDVIGGILDALNVIQDLPPSLITSVDISRVKRPEGYAYIRLDLTGASQSLIIDIASNGDLTWRSTLRAGMNSIIPNVADISRSCYYDTMGSPMRVFWNNLDGTPMLIRDPIHEGRARFDEWLVFHMLGIPYGEDSSGGSGRTILSPDIHPDYAAVCTAAGITGATTRALTLATLRWMLLWYANQGNLVLDGTTFESWLGSQGFTSIDDARTNGNLLSLFEQYAGTVGRIDPSTIPPAP